MADIKIQSDPARPHGGYARLSLPASDLTEETATVSVFDAYSERYLGRDGYQGEKVEFGPYPVEREGDRAWVTVGPEIVNQIEEYAQVRIGLAGHRTQTSWPEDIAPAFGAARLGDIFTSAPASAPVEDTSLVGRYPTTQPEPEPAPAPEARRGAARRRRHP